MALKELSWRQRGHLWLRLGIRTALTAGFLLLLFYAVPPLVSLFMPFVLAFLVAWLMNPLIRTLQKRTAMSRKLLAFLLVLLIFGASGGILFVFIYNVGGEAIMLANDWQTVWGGISGSVEQVGGAFSGILNLLPPEAADLGGGLLDQFSAWLQSGISDLITRFAAQAGTWAIGLPSFLVALVVFMMGTYFISADYPRLHFLLTDRMSTEMHTFLHMVKSTAAAAFGGYFRAQFILTVGVFFILLLGFIVIGQPYFLIIAFLLAVLDFIPIVGAGTAMVPWSIISLMTGDLRKALSLIIIWGIVALFRRVAEPKVLGTQTGLSPVLSLACIYIGMRLAGILGMILGPILCLIFLNICKSGVFDGALADLKMAVSDIRALLNNRP